jgi:methylated-DNA-[protein]-cysteine S-methyltransferase
VKRGFASVQDRAGFIDSRARVMSANARYQAKLPTSFGMLGVRTESEFLLGIDFLDSDTAPLPAADLFTVEVCRQLRAYLADPAFRFELPLAVGGTSFQKRVWGEISRIPRGKTRSYSEVAEGIGSGARAVGAACGANRVPLVIPCHRVVGHRGIGGFMNANAGSPLAVKRWLLDHERK